MANRLSEDANHKVLVLEYGRPDHWWDPLIHMPAALSMPIGNARYDWGYQTEPEPHLNHRHIYHARGKVLGGSSSINGMIFQRGNAQDFDQWAKIKGLEEWSYQHCLPYFKKMENAFESPYRGTDGPLHLERVKEKNPLLTAFLNGAHQEGYPLTEDVNGEEQEGFGLFDRNIKNSRRWSAARAYYHPVKHRQNLSLKTSVLVGKIIIEKKKAIGVEYQHKQSFHKVYGKQIILCGGAFNSPQLLQLSGIGDGQHLKSLGIQTLVELPGVGQNLQDHLEVYVQYHCQKPVSLAPALKWWRRPEIGLRWLLGRSGPGASNHFEGGGFIRSHPRMPYPNLMFHFLPLAIRYDGSSPTPGHGYQVHVGPMYSNSRGQLSIQSQDPKQHPKIQFNYLSTAEDRQEWIEAIFHARKLLNSKALAEFNGGEISPGPQVQSEDEIINWVRQEAETALHPCGTCQMGLHEQSVVHPKTMQVHGVENLRVVDASVMPVITNANLYAPTMMIAEKAADLILGQTEESAPSDL